MMGNAKVSVIVPVRNGHIYIRRALQSVFAQDYSNWELIIVDDGSTDGTDKIISEFIQDKRLIYIKSEEHIGVSAARNLGMDRTNGTYVVFLDSDDTLSPNSLTTRVNQIEREHVNLACSAFYLAKKRDVVAHIPCDSGYYTNKGFLARISESQAGKTVGIEYIWDKIFDLNIIKEQRIRFDETMDQYEDRVFVMDYLRSLDTYTNRVLVSEGIVYCYYGNHEGSLSNTYNLQSLDKLKNYYAKLKDELNYYGIFDGKVATGYYHSYVNKIIGQVIAYQRENIGGLHYTPLYRELSSDKDFLRGLAEYQCRNKYETEDTLNMLKELMRP